MKRSKKEIIQDLIKELSEAPDTVIVVKNNIGGGLVLDITKEQNTINISINNVEYADAGYLLNIGDKVIITQDN